MLTRIKELNETEKEKLMSTLQFKEMPQPEPNKIEEKDQDEEEELELSDL